MLEHCPGRAVHVPALPGDVVRRELAEKAAPGELLAVLDTKADRSLAEGEPVVWYRSFRFWWIGFIARFVALYLIF